MTAKKEIGNVTHFYSRISVAVIELTDELKVGDQIAIEGSTTSFEQAISSMQIEKENFEVAKAGQMIGLKVADRVRPGDIVYKLTPE